MLKGFKEFLMRGNVVDLAVAVVVGGAFAKVIDALATDLIGSILAWVGHMPDFTSATIGEIKIGSTITALIYFVIVAAAVYFVVVVPLNRLSQLRRSRAQPTEVPGPEDIALLTEIRDLLAQPNPRA